MAITTPRFRPGYHVQTIDGAGTFLLTERAPTVLNGQLYELVCPLIDGTRSADDIVAALDGRTTAAEVYYALDVLERRRFVEDADDAIPRAERAFWHTIDLDPSLARANLAANAVRVVALGDIDGGIVADALGGAGMRVDDSAPFTVVVTDDYRRPEIDAIDEVSVDHHRPWALVKPVGAYPWIGPFFHPRRPGCWQCLVARIRMNYATDTLVEATSGVLPVTAVAATPASVTAVANMAAIELARWIAAGGESRLVNALMCVDLATLDHDRHVLTPRPQCPRCGDELYRSGRAWARDPEPLPLERQAHLQGDHGGHRTATAQQTLERYADLVSPITGVVSRLDRVSPPDHPLVHAYSASHNWATHPDSLAFLKQTLRSQSGGKGTTDEQARVGALAEAIERYSGVFRGDEVRRRATRDQLGADAIEPNAVMCFSDAQRDRRTQINAEGNSFQMVPEPFASEQPADWSPLWAPTSGRHRWVPTSLLYYSYSRLAPHDTPNRMAAFADSNGCAAGNTREEAALQAMLELVERDAIATWWYNEVRRPRLDLGQLSSPYLDALLEWLDDEGRELWVVDVTNDIGIPVFAAVSRVREPREGESENLVVGFGAHLDPAVAAMRAITEVNQFFASLFALGDDGLHKAFDPGAVDWWASATTENKHYLMPRDGEVRQLSSYEDLTSPDLLDEVQTTIDMIEARHLEVLLLDQTRPDVGLPVIKAVVPGMRHFWARLGPGRLYDVPVELGWLPAPRAEADLNRTPVFF